MNDAQSEASGSDLREEMETALVQLDALRMKLAQIEEPGEVKHIRDKAEALRAYAKTRGESLVVQNDFAEIKLIAERRAGEMLAGIPGLGSHGGDRRSNDIVSLETLGIRPKESELWQREAEVSEEAFLRYVAETMGPSCKGCTCPGRRLNRNRWGREGIVKRNSQDMAIC